MKNQKINNLFILIISVLVSSLVSVAAAGNLFDSNEVVYDNTSSGMSSTNVKDAVDELYAAASDYSNIDSRVTTLEGHFPNDNAIKGIHAVELNQDGTLSNYGGYIDFHYNGSADDFTTRIIENSSGGLNIYNRSNTATVKINYSNVITDAYFEPTSFTITPASGITFTQNTCYKMERIRTCSIWIGGLDATKFPANAETVIGSVPSGHRPSYTVWGTIGTVGGEGNGNLYYKINADGTIKVSRRGSNAVTAILMGATWIV